ncbi:transcriptional regulator, AsnC family [Nitratifractor salsuginis DSM 16511]|uniref:siroheme decarboxylase n=2 Tax=Nitratifractor salsuginis TaxID=269261 RepID=E6X0K7_NITSE|nr:transcriptional regulator, AsnC family [Nitratifractor salsuginis DSM 16511]
MREELLYRMQNAFPLTARPFQVLGEELGASEEEVLSEVRRLKEEGIIRQTSAIFDTKKLGYHSSLVAFKVPEERIETAAEIINSHPGVSHNYLRNHDFNIWFTLAVLPDSRMGLLGTVQKLKELTQADESIILPTLKMFKISVKLDTTGKQSKKERVHKKELKPIRMRARHFAAIRELQKDIPVIAEPFAPAIERLNMSYDELFALAKELQEAGVMRRFATILNHRKAGFTANAMSVWNVPEDQAEELGKKIAEFRAVSHCYLRPKYPNWPYNLFAMVHAQSQEACDELIDEIARETGLKEYGKLYSTREFKKKRLVYFDPAFEEWERKYEG